MRLDNEWDNIVEKALRKWNVPGTAIAVVHGGESCVKAYGLAELPARKLETNSIFPTMSTNKAFLAAATALVIDDTKASEQPLTWDTPISSVIPDDFGPSDITFEDALSHRSGQPGHEPKLSLASRDEDLQNLVRSMRHLSPAYPLRTTWEYNTFMYMVVSHALVQKMGESLESFLQRRIWLPLGMGDTYFSTQKVRKMPGIQERLVKGYEWVSEAKKYKLYEPINYQPLEGVGSMASTVLDYEKWIKALLTKSTPLSAESYEALFHPRSILSKPDSVSASLNCAHLYALGWFVDNYQGYPFYWHTGGWPGVSILLGLIPDKQFGFVMMSNSRYAGRELQIDLYHCLINRCLNLPIPQSIIDNGEQGPSGTVGLQKPETSIEATARLFSKHAGTSTAPILPLSSYVGTYINKGYGSITINLDKSNGSLHADLLDRVTPSRMDLEHVTRNYFLAKIYEPGWDSAGIEYYVTEFRISSNDKVDKVGFNFEPALGEGELIWFTLA
ncbi:beta-lactamase/transpeptidase-like protein [Talaromyces proteolyticus]|uniref:Beta-lactamase/transpeptidase-like protein n=1 Tax=Talaromyces proteolyticus TaxID=1131652 RepID=A0AAD4KTB9_9EURO|nr:beta-lactamase/transpeptidase-like protein [Talaromyces proteolyticus]KAH8696131.1 beta-lactamase/transpeptidase-like protein [Talaromyces proteolyticus]